MPIDAPSSTWFTTAPDWGWLIVLYLFFGSLAGGTYFIAALIDLGGRREDRPLAKLGYLAAIPLLLVSGALLLADLYRPDRFWHLFIENHTFRPMFKYWAPMSIGSWGVAVFGLFAGLSFLGALARQDGSPRRWTGRLRSPGVVGTMVTAFGAVLALYMAGYPGVLLSVTNRPVWADTPLLGMLFVISGVSLGAAFMLLLAWCFERTLPAVRSLDRMLPWLSLLEFIALVAVAVSLGAAIEAWLNGWGLLLVLGVVVLGMLVPLMLHRRAGPLDVRALALVPLLVLGGGLVLRAVIVLSSEAI